MIHCINDLGNKSCNKKIVLPNTKVVKVIMDRLEVEKLARDSEQIQWRPFLLAVKADRGN